MTIIKRALISVSDKTGVVEFARRLHAQHVEILSTGGTAKLLHDNNVPVIEVSDYTGFPEMMDGRIKTLHPKIHGGLLGRRGFDETIMAQYGIQPIDLVAVNLYPFAKTVEQADCDLALAIENIDIGGPTLLRAAAKNHTAVTVVVDHADYPLVLDEIEQTGGAVCDMTRFRLAVKAYEHTAQYDGTIANYLGTIQADGTRACFPHSYTTQFIKAQDLRYGENPHQRAAFYVEYQPQHGNVATARQLQGKELSFNNIADTDAALECVKGLTESPACVIVKHANPCGAALGKDLHEAYDRAYATDPISAFGGVLAFNQIVDAQTAQMIIDRQFVEVIVAPDFTKQAMSLLATKKNIRILACGLWKYGPFTDFDYKRVSGGLLIQERDFDTLASHDLKTVTSRTPLKREMRDLLFAWRIAKFVKSNAIVYARAEQTIGIGAGQMSRVDSARIAALKATDAGLTVQGSVMASDAFFPFRDGLDSAAAAGIVAVIQPGGSVRDEEIIAAANEHHIAMVFTGMRHFRH